MKDKAGSEEKVCCACLRVDYLPEELPDGKMRERWRCGNCGMEFIKARTHQPTEEQRGEAHCPLCIQYIDNMKALRSQLKDAREERKQECTDKLKFFNDLCNANKILVEKEECIQGLLKESREVDADPEGEINEQNAEIAEKDKQIEELGESLLNKTSDFSGAVADMLKLKAKLDISEKNERIHREGHQAYVKIAGDLDVELQKAEKIIEAGKEMRKQIEGSSPYTIAFETLRSDYDNAKEAEKKKA
ncbi:hypothetical protein LCGC14_2245330 [marine sediment metagenome]|uniref:Uncharacterized protein n=1 Tax=marine sediment metagenome TaxID=412755 RepID=A0A0F9FGS0_9ZZZZ